MFLEIEVQGGLQILEKYPDVLSIFILPTSIDSLSRRLHRRGTEDEKPSLSDLQRRSMRCHLRTDISTML